MSSITQHDPALYPVTLTRITAPRPWDTFKSFVYEQLGTMVAEYGVAGTIAIILATWLCLGVLAALVICTAIIVRRSLRARRKNREVSVSQSTVGTPAEDSMHIDRVVMTAKAPFGTDDDLRVLQMLTERHSRVQLSAIRASRPNG